MEKGGCEYFIKLHASVQDKNQNALEDAAKRFQAALLQIKELKIQYKRRVTFPRIRILTVPQHGGRENPSPYTGASSQDLAVYRRCLSYNWLNKPEPTILILVPGMPPKWIEHSKHPYLAPDSGFPLHSTQNADRTPQCTAGGLRKLFGFVNGDADVVQFLASMLWVSSHATRKQTREEVGTR